MYITTSQHGMKGFKAMEVKFGINKYDKVFDRVDTD
jgi:hypothetical protein